MIKNSEAVNEMADGAFKIASEHLDLYVREKMKNTELYIEIEDYKQAIELGISYEESVAMTQTRNEAMTESQCILNSMMIYDKNQNLNT